MNRLTLVVTLIACGHPPAARAPAKRTVDPDVLSRCTRELDAWNATRAECERNPHVENGIAFPCRPMNPTETAATACADLYSRAACRDAWTATSTPEGLVGSPYAEIVKPCAAAYCADLPSPRPAACAGAEVENGDWLGELDTAILVYEGVPSDRAALLAARRDPMTYVAGVSTQRVK